MDSRSYAQSELTRAVNLLQQWNAFDRYGQIQERIVLLPEIEKALANSLSTTPSPMATFLWVRFHILRYRHDLFCSRGAVDYVGARKDAKRKMEELLSWLQHDLPAETSLLSQPASTLVLVELELQDDNRSSERFHQHLKGLDQWDTPFFQFVKASLLARATSWIRSDKALSTEAFQCLVTIPDISEVAKRHLEGSHNEWYHEMMRDLVHVSTEEDPDHPGDMRFRDGTPPLVMEFMHVEMPGVCLKHPGYED